MWFDATDCLDGYPEFKEKVFRIFAKDRPSRIIEDSFKRISRYIKKYTTQNEATYVDGLIDPIVSLKIITARHSDSSPEIDVRNRLSCGDLHHPGRSYVLSPLNEFHITGPNGHHLCLVSELTGPSISEVKTAGEYGMLPIEAAQSITAQLALGLNRIYSYGIIYRGL